jgi:hypothetical protein
MPPDNQEPEETTEEVKPPAPNPIDELTLPRTEPEVISNPASPYKKLFIALGILVLLAGMATGYVLFRHK